MQSRIDRLRGQFAGELADAVAHASREALPFEEATVYHGLAGLVLIAAEVAPEALDTLDTGSLRAAMVALETPAAEVAHIPGLYFGASGIALAQVVAGAHLKDAALAVDGRAMLENILRYDSFVPDVTHGWAGYVLACLAAHHVEGDKTLRKFATEAGDRLVTLMQRTETGAVWPWPKGPHGTLAGATPHGFAHGTAGVAHALLALYGETCEDVYRDAALAGLATLHTTARTVPEADDAVWWPVSNHDDACWNAWCHGNPGIVKTLAKAVALLHREEDHVLLLRALRGVATANNPGYCLCHGIASRLDAYADALPVLGDAAAEFAEEAQRDLALLATLDVYPLENEAPSLERGGVSRGVMTGAAGVMRTALRFQRPETALLLP